MGQKSLAAVSASAIGQFLFPTSYTSVHCAASLNVAGCFLLPPAKHDGSINLLTVSVLSVDWSRSEGEGREERRWREEGGRRHCWQSVDGGCHGD